METSRYLSIAEAVAQTPFSRAFLYKFIQSGELRSVKIGARRVIFADDLTAFMERQREAQPAAGGRA